MQIDPTLTPVSKGETQEILGLDEALYQDLKSTGLLRASVQNSNRSSDAFACHSFFDLLYCALVPQLVHWLRTIDFEDFEEIVDFVTSIKCQGEYDCFPYLPEQKLRKIQFPTENVHGQLDQKSREIAAEIMRVWDIIGDHFVKLISADAKADPPAFEDTLRLLTSKHPDAPFSAECFLYVSVRSARSNDL